MFNNYFFGFDYDGTLTLPGTPISTELKQTISDLPQLGAHVFFASGKSMEFLQNLAGEIGITPYLICAENGGHIRTADGTETTFGKQGDLDRFKELLPSIMPSLPSFTLETKISIWTGMFADRVDEAKSVIEKLIGDNKLKLSILTHPDGGLDVVPDGIDKENLLPYIPPEPETVVLYFGDSHNDCQIMSAGRVTPHTVENADPRVKQIVVEKKGVVAVERAGAGVLSILNKLLATILRPEAARKVDVDKLESAIKTFAEPVAPYSPRLFRSLQATTPDADADKLSKTVLDDRVCPHSPGLFRPEPKKVSADVVPTVTFSQSGSEA